MARTAPLRPLAPAGRSGSGFPGDRRRADWRSPRWAPSPGHARHVRPKTPPAEETSVVTTTASRETDSILSKVPAVTLGFWIIKILATTLGETGGETVTLSLLGETT